VAKADRGTKRQCQSCATKFYDLNREPVLCPSCGAEFKLVVAEVPVEKEKVVEEVKTEVVDTDAAAVVVGAEVISLDDVEDDDDDDDDDEDVIENLPDVDLDDDEDPIASEDDNTFLETDDDDDEIGFDVPVKKNEDI
jgi:uncharacterized protein (TIGR02300 family)